MARAELIHQRLTCSIIGAFYEVYNTLGYGFLEHLYVLALERELLARGHGVGREVWVPVRYKGEELGKQRLDLLVDDLVVVEAKSSHALPVAASRQLYNYLRATNLEVGLLLHFGPDPHFYRVISRNVATIDPQHPMHPMHADDPSVLDAGDGGGLAAP
jgi:GxxExxY protein